MDVLNYFTVDNMEEWIEQYRAWGPFIGILLPMLEAFLPFLPLFLFVVANATAFGLGFGFLYSWIGACGGALIVFLLVRAFGKQRWMNFLHRHAKVQSLMKWVEEHGFGPLFILLCFPFTPSAIVNIVAGLSRINIYQYMLAVVSGKMVMIFIMSYIGADLASFITQPVKAIIAAGVICLLWFIGKRIEVRLQKRVEGKRVRG
ncbi:membrane protein [Bacillus coahuilensis p1.1.43]|uniref:TVP38/TMEM64 family membrane protein n=1 Tax=Bacillus coahuilensis p1.1.43 TaxID=1150625 RepID=A0A147KAH9_9BACI|nr:TVP38/TMEM64 family protein [Bacillus coahuilensis]KUP07728.1 membrane protein [Bacillus coahuilensis p1.1.43]